MGNSPVEYSALIKDPNKRDPTLENYPYHTLTFSHKETIIRASTSTSLAEMLEQVPVWAVPANLGLI